MCKLESILVNETYKIHLVLIRKLDLAIIIQTKKKRKRICYLVDFVILADHRVEIKEKTDKYLDFAREPMIQFNYEKIFEYESW